MKQSEKLLELKKVAEVTIILGFGVGLMALFMPVYTPTDRVFWSVLVHISATGIFGGLAIKCARFLYLW